MYRKYGIFLFILCLISVGLYFSWSKIVVVSSWKVDSELGLPKKANEYDVIIVGGGIGGLSSGALLAKGGCKVLLVEKNRDVGGYASHHTKDGFTFSYGPEDINGLWKRGSITYLLNSLGLHKDVFFIPNTRRYFVGDEWFDVGSDEYAFERAIAEKFPEEKQAIQLFFEKAKKVYLEAYDAVMIEKWGIIVPQEFVSSVMSEKWQSSYEEKHIDLLEWDEKSYQDILDEYFQSSKLKKVLSSFLGYLGAIPVKTSASNVVIKTFGYFFFGGYHIVETPQHLADHLKEYIKEHGGKVTTNSFVDTIVTDDEGVKGICVAGDTYFSKIVISNVNAKTTYFDLVDGIDREFLKEIKKMPMGKSTFALYLGVDDELTSYPSLLQDQDNQLYISIISKNDPTLAPEKKSAVIVRESARYVDFLGKNPIQLEKYLQKRASALLEKAVDLMPELRERVCVQVIKTPKDFEELVDMPQGAIYGFDFAKVPKRPYFKSPIKGLYLVGASTSGPGISSVISGGVLCAHDIMGWIEER